MRKYKNNGFTATVTDKVVRWEIPIRNLVYEFETNPENPSYDGEHCVKIKKGKRKKFARYIAKEMIEECDQKTGASYIEQAMDNVFATIYEDNMDFANYPY